MERANGEGKAERIARSLYAKYYPGQLFHPSCYRIVGSYGKGTAARPRTDIDMVFIIPTSQWDRINAIAWNKQNYLLQEVKGVLLDSNPNTDVRGSGPVVIVPFDTYKVEVVPSFVCDRNGLLINAHTKDGGSWKTSNPFSELADLNKVDTESAGMLRDLCKMLKAWKDYCNVEIRSVCLEIVAIVFIRDWAHKGKGQLYYDFMVRDFFAFLLQYVDGRGKPAGIDEWIPLGDCWESKAQCAYDRASKAWVHEQHEAAFSAVDEWQKIFGPKFKHSSLSSLMAGLL